MKRRKVLPSEVHHVYQKTIGNALLFYTETDYLVFFTVFSVFARKHGLRVLALCPMPDHIHQVVQVESWRQLSAFIQCYTRVFAQQWNRSRKRKGPLFHHPFGSAAKVGVKKIRTALSYCNNNPVERKLSCRPQDYRWTFLSYRENPSPYSEPLNPSRSSARMKKILRDVKVIFDNGGYLRYSPLDRWERQLPEREWKQLTDFIIGLWNVIDYDRAIGYYGNYQTMLRAFSDNTGGEYDIREEFNPWSDTVYADFARILLQEGMVRNLREIPQLDEKRKNACRCLLERRTSARPRQILKYLHIN